MKDSDSPLKKTKKRGLGRGLSALIPDIEAADLASDNTKDLRHMEISLLEANPYQPRQKFENEALEELALSIKEKGVLQPVLVRENKGVYQIIAGERRVRAAKIAGLKLIPVLIKDLNDKDMLQISIIENIQRDALNPVEEARAYKRLGEEFKMTQEDIARSIGKNRSTISNFIRLLHLPEAILSAMEDGEISMGHGRALLAVSDRKLLFELFYEILRRDLSVRESEALINSKNQKETKKEISLPLKKEYRETLKDLSDSLGFTLKIRGNAESGKLEIPYKDNKSLELLLEKLKKLN